jgi:hypothetical protein
MPDKRLTNLMAQRFARAELRALHAGRR